MHAFPGFETAHAAGSHTRPSSAMAQAPKMVQIQHSYDIEYSKPMASIAGPNIPVGARPMRKRGRFGGIGKSESTDVISAAAGNSDEIRFRVTGRMPFSTEKLRL